MAEINMILNKVMNCISEFWHIATTKSSAYEYIIEDIQLQERNNVFSSQIYYRAIGSRTVMYDAASELNESDIFSKFPHTQAQAIVTLATLETTIHLDKEKLVANLYRFLEKYVQSWRYKVNPHIALTSFQF